MKHNADIRVSIDLSIESLEGRNLYADWYLTFKPSNDSLHAALGLDLIPDTVAKVERLARYQTAEPGRAFPVPRLIPIGVGEWVEIRVSPIDGRLLGFELFGIQPGKWLGLEVNFPIVSEIGAISLPLTQTHDKTIFFEDYGIYDHMEEGYRQTDYQVSANEPADVFRVQFISGRSANLYVRLANCLVAGLNGDTLVELWFQNVRQEG
jgi:hypothetical protein